MDKNLVRVEEGKQLAGVATGLARHLDIDVTIVRLIFIFLTLAGGPGILAYIILAIMMPEASSVSTPDMPVEKGPIAI